MNKKANKIVNEDANSQYTDSIFESIKHLDEYGNEYWYARELQKVLDYKDWRNFEKVIDKAIVSAKNSISNRENWVVEVNKPIKTGKGQKEIIKDYKLSRYICYKVASSAGVKNMAEFHNAGYRGLYNGETADDIFKRKKLRYREDILDNMNEDNEKNNQEKNFTSVGINWYPGHMAKTKKQIEEDLKIIDIVIELLDARIPISSQNPNIAEITKRKKKLIVLNKSDLADEEQNLLWLQYFENKNIPAVIVDSNSGKGIEKCIKKIEKVMNNELKIQANKGRVGRKIRTMVVGIPNVGKSSFINKIAKKTTQEVGNRPGVTKQKQWIRINDKIELLDTPGVLWPKFESEEIALNLSFTGTIKEEILNKIDVAYYLTRFLIENYQEKLCERYKITKEFIEEKLAQDKPENENIYEIMLEIGRKRGCIISGGNIDEEKTARIILDEFKNGILGRITIECVNS